MLQTMQTNLSGLSSPNRWRSRPSNYLQGVYEVAGAEEGDADTVVEARKLDYELLERWIKYMEKPTDKYKYKEAWQAMMKNAPSAGSRGRRRRTRHG